MTDVSISTRLPPRGPLTTLSVKNASELASLPDAQLNDGAYAYVETYRDSFRLDKATPGVAVPDVVIRSTGGGSWTRLFMPSRSWLESTLCVSGAGSSEAVGSPSSPITIAEFLRRVAPLLPTTSGSEGAITCSVVGDVGGGVGIFADAPSFGAGAPGITFDGSAGRVALASGVLAGSSPVVLGNALTSTPGTPWTATCTGFTWAPYVQKIAHVTSGPNAGAQFRILHDLGGGVALIGQPAFISDYSFDEASVGAGDAFTIFRYPHFGDTLTVGGSAAFNFHQLECGSEGLHDVTFLGPSVAFLDTCVVQNLDGQGMQDLRATGCLIRSCVRSYASSSLEIWNSDTFTVSTVHSGTVSASDWTCFGGGVQGGEGPATLVVDGGWLALLSCPSPALDLTPGLLLTTADGGRVFGTGCPAPRIHVPQGRVGYFPSGFPPNVVGASVPDVDLAGAPTAESALPATNAGSLAALYGI